MHWSALALALSLQTSGPSTDVPDVLVPSIPEQTELLQAHYALAADELEREDVSRLDPRQRAERARLLDVLRAFGARGEFNHDPVFHGARVPYFRDEEGRRCAVAELMHASGEDAFVERVHAENNDAWICELRGDAEFHAWLDRSGLTIEDAARIQAPPLPIGGGRGWVDTGPGGATPPASGGRSPAPAGGSYGGPGDTRPSGGGGGSTPSGPATGGTPAGPRTGGASGGTGAPTTPTTAGAPGGGGGAPRPATLTMTDDDTWWLWWEYNKSEFLLPNQLVLPEAPATGDDPSAAMRSAIGSARDGMLAVFETALKDTDANVRGTAAIAIGRVEGKRSVSSLLALLEDANVDVRHKAILGLGASGSMEAVPHLVAIARTGSLGSDATSRISPQARAVAIVALGLARRNGAEPGLDHVVEALVRERAKADRELIGTAALVYGVLAPGPELQRLALAMALDDSESPSVRCRAVESLRNASGERMLADLQRFLNGPRLDLRRSAALALGGFRDSLALPALMVAADVEAESLTRGLILISIGKQGGPKAQDYLMHVLEKGDGNQRRWAALALGVDARRVPDADRAAALGAAIRAAGAREKNQDAVGAYWIASGLARDTAAFPSIRDGLTSSGNPRQRMYAATALALLGGDAAEELLRARMQAEMQSVVRVAITQSLGVLGDPSDAPAMQAELLGLTDPMLQAQASSAMALHGTPESLQALTELARAQSGSSVRRAAAIEGLGMMLSPHEPMALLEVARGANYTVFADWVNGMFQTTL